MPQVPPKSLQGRQARPLPIHFLQLLDTADSYQSLRARFVVAHSPAEVLLHFALNERAKFFLQIGLASAPASHPPNSRDQRANLSHREPPWGTKWLRIETVRCQFSDCLFTSLRPARVSV